MRILDNRFSNQTTNLSDFSICSNKYHSLVYSVHTKRIETRADCVAGLDRGYVYPGSDAGLCSAGRGCGGPGCVCRDCAPLIRHFEYFEDSFEDKSKETEVPLVDIPNLIDLEHLQNLKPFDSWSRPSLLQWAAFLSSRRSEVRYSWIEHKLAQGLHGLHQVPPNLYGEHR